MTDAAVCPYGIIRTNRKTLDLQWVERFVLILFPLKTPPKWGSGEGVKKQGCTLRTNFWTTNKEVKMGSWGINHYKGDYGLDLLGAIVDRQLKILDFSTFKWQTHSKLSRWTLWKKSGRPIEATPRRSWLSFSAKDSRTLHTGTLLIAECLADFYCTGELAVYDYVGENYDPVEYRIRKFEAKSQRLTYSCFWKNCKASRTRSIGCINPGSGRRMVGPYSERLPDLKGTYVAR